jgi:transposase
MKVTTLRIDLAKNSLQLHRVNEQDKIALQKRVSQSKLRETVAQPPPCVIEMEACASAHYLDREFQLKPLAPTGASLKSRAKPSL